MIILPKYNDASYQKASKALDIRLRLEGTTFKQKLINILFAEVSRTGANLDENETLEMYELIKEIQNDTPTGVRRVQEFKEELILHYMQEQELMEAQGESLIYVPETT